MLVCYNWPDLLFDILNSISDDDQQNVKISAHNPDNL